MNAVNSTGDRSRTVRLEGLPQQCEGVPVAVKKAAQKAATRKVNRNGQRWMDDRPGMTLRLPLDLREAITSGRLAAAANPP